MTNLYADRDTNALEPHYSAHVAAMTEEGLDRKSDIAAELAFRDAKIDRLQQDVRDAVDCGDLKRCKACKRLGLRPGWVCLLCGHDSSYVPESRP